jgi:ABC-type transport system involved in multi-copper enzyme maturation permease subunit
MTEDKANTKSTEYLQKFTYRLYDGKFQPRWMRVLYLIRFELISTWRKSKFAKYLMIIVLMFSFFSILGAALLRDIETDEGEGKEVLRDALNEAIASYFAIDLSFILSNSDGISYGLGRGLGMLLLIVIGLAGSGFFADDKHGKVIEIYLSRLDKREYITGKVGAIVVYINILVTLPLIITGILFVQSLEKEHEKFLDYYMGIIIYSVLCSIILGLFILVLSIFVEKRSYASLVFFLTFLFGSIIGGVIAQDNLDNEFLLLISPTNFLVLLAYVCLGDYDLGVRDMGREKYRELNLNNGMGLEYWHVLLQAFIFILVLALILAYKIWKTTTEEL